MAEQDRSDQQQTLSQDEAVRDLERRLGRKLTADEADEVRKKARENLRPTFDRDEADHDDA